MKRIFFLKFSFVLRFPEYRKNPIKSLNFNFKTGTHMIFFLLNVFSIHLVVAFYFVIFIWIKVSFFLRNSKPVESKESNETSFYYYFDSINYWYFRKIKKKVIKYLLIYQIIIMLQVEYSNFLLSCFLIVLFSFDWNHKKLITNFL